MWKLNGKSGRKSLGEHHHDFTASKSFLKRTQSTNHKEKKRIRTSLHKKTALRIWNGKL